MNALVIGAARSGVGVALLLVQQQYHVTLVSNRDFEARSQLEGLGVHVILSDAVEAVTGEFDLVVKNPGIPNSHPLVQRYPRVMNEIEVAQMFNPNMKLYGISGTNGKTTTTLLLDLMLKAKSQDAVVAGNIGVSLSEIVMHTGPTDYDVALELSSFQMENLDGLKLKTYALLNLTPDHLDRYDSVEAYYRVKADFADHADVLFYNLDDANVVATTQSLSVKKYSVSLKHDADIMIQEGLCLFNGETLFDVSQLKLAGKHNLSNAMFTAITAHFAGVSRDQIETALRNFKGAEHRLEYVATHHGVRYYNDSKATNPESTEVALQAFDDNQVLLLAGGYDKHVSFDLLKPLVGKTKAVYVFGESAKQIHAVFQNAIEVTSMLEGLKRASAQAAPGDVVLLSPACASFDQFKDYEQRGQIFKDAVHTLTNNDE